MKKKLVLLSSILLLVASTAFAAPRQKVLAEIFTATWCGYCPATANAAEEMRENEDPVAIIEYHKQDAYSTSNEPQRREYYTSTTSWQGGIPQAIFDGLLQVGGGAGANSTNYSRFLPKFTQRMGIDSPCAMEIGSTINGNNLNVNVTITLDAGENLDGKKLRVAVTESYISENWNGMHTLEFVERAMLPDYNGTTLNFNGNNQVTINLSKALNASWVKKNLEIVAFIQNDTNREVYQAEALNLMEVMCPPPASISSVSNLSNGNIAINWEAPANSTRGLTGYKVFKDDVLLTTTDSSTLTYEDSDVALGFSYLYKVVALYDNFGGTESKFTEEIRASLGAKNTPTNLTAVVADINEADIGWQKPIDDANVDNYNVYVNDNLVGIANNTMFRVPALNSGVHQIVVKAVNSGVESDATNTAEINITLYPVANLRGTVPSSNDKVIVQWDAPEIVNAIRAVTKFKLYRNNEFLVERTSRSYFDRDVVAEQRYEYYVIAVYSDLYESPASNHMVVDNLVVSANDATAVNFSITNIPNPFNPETNFCYTLPKASNVRIDIYNVLGQKIKTVVNEYQTAGKHTSVKWLGKTDNGENAASGIYFYKIKAGNHSETKKMILLK